MQFDIILAWLLLGTIAFTIAAIIVFINTRIKRIENKLNESEIFINKHIDTSLIYDVEVDGIDTTDYPDFCDAYISYACWNTGVPLNDEELDVLNNDSDFVYKHVIGHLY